MDWLNNCFLQFRADIALRSLCVDHNLDRIIPEKDFIVLITAVLECVNVESFSIGIKVADEDYIGLTHQVVVCACRELTALSGYP